MDAITAPVSIPLIKRYPAARRPAGTNPGMLALTIDERGIFDRPTVNLRTVNNHFITRSVYLVVLAIPLP